MVKNWTRDDIITNARLAGQVERYHVWPTIRKQTVAEHVWQVLRIYVELFGTPEPDVWQYILHHDSGELVTGDLPFPLKARHPDLKKMMDGLEDDALAGMGIGTIPLTSEQKWKMKVCDLLEMLEFGLQEMSLGNRLAEPIVKGTSSNLRQLCEDMTLAIDGAATMAVKSRVVSTIQYWTGERANVV